jgi:hypothetical protein
MTTDSVPQVGGARRRRGPVGGPRQRLDCGPGQRPGTSLGTGLLR